jgi:hypothetical protein
MPYGGEQQDHEILKELDIQPYLFKKNDRMQLVYAGAMLPKAYGPLEAIFKSIRAHPQLFKQVAFHFIGTGKTANDLRGFNIKSLAEKYGLWRTIVYEYPARIPYLDVLVHLKEADGIFILGSTEPHYTPSKTYQGVLSGKPILAVLHGESTAVKILRQSGAGLALEFKGENDMEHIQNSFPAVFEEYSMWMKSYDPACIKKQVFEAYSAKEVTKKLVGLLNRAAG